MFNIVDSVTMTYSTFKHYIILVWTHNKSQKKNSILQKWKIFVHTKRKKKEKNSFKRYNVTPFAKSSDIRKSTQSHWWLCNNSECVKVLHKVSCDFFSCTFRSYHLQKLFFWFFFKHLLSAIQKESSTSMQWIICAYDGVCNVFNGYVERQRSCTKKVTKIKKENCEKEKKRNE